MLKYSSPLKGGCPGIYRSFRSAADMACGCRAISCWASVLVWPCGGVCLQHSILLRRCSLLLYYTVRWLCHGFLFLSHPPTSRSLLFDLLTRQNKCYVMECGNLRHVAAVVTCCTTMPPRTRLFPSQCTHHTHADSLPE